MSLLEVRDLTVEYSSAGYVVRPVRDFSLEMEAGELGLVLGPSGCGKSTLLSALAGLLRPAAGAIRVDGSARDRVGRGGARPLPTDVDRHRVPGLQPDPVAQRAWRTSSSCSARPAALERRPGGAPKRSSNRWTWGTI